MKIVFCGGHHNSALVVAEKFKGKGNQIFWFGHKYSMIGDENLSAEYLEVVKKGIEFFEIKAGKLQVNYKFWQYLFRIPMGFWQSFAALLRIKPEVILSFGGYIALPVVVCGYVLGIPVFTQEQTVVSGWANRIIAKLSKKIFISFKSSAKYFPEGKTVYSGLPVRKTIFERGKKIFNNPKRAIYITGGKQGAHVINEAVFDILPKLVAKFNIIHQCGSSSLHDDIKKAEELKRKLGKESKNYLVKMYFFEEEIGNIYSNADFLVSRAGAHTVYELFLLKKPAILIPLPWSSYHEQGENAKTLRDFGLAEILSQEDLEKGKLLQTIIEFEKNLQNFKLREGVCLPPLDAAEKIIEEVEKTVKK